MNNNNPNAEVQMINLYFTKIRLNYLFIYIYLVSSILLGIFNRKLYSFGFKFSFTLMLIQQTTTIIFFQFVFPLFKNYKTILGGPITFSEFKAKKWSIISFSFIFTINILSSFLGNQTVSTNMFLCLRRYLIVFNYLYDLIINKKTLPSYFLESLVLFTLGATVSYVSGVEII